MSTEAAPASASAAAAAPAAPTNRVFVGNLPFKTTKDSLREFFAALNPTEATVAARGRRALGYGFVTFADDASAQQAIKDFNDKDLEGRAVRLQPARPRKPQAERDESKPRSRSPRPRKPRTERREGQPRRPAAPKDGQAAPAAASTNAAAPATGDKPAGDRPPRRGPRRNPTGDRPPRRPAGDKPAASAPATGDKPAGDRPPRRSGPRPAAIRVDNDKAFFVANLPFSVNDETLVSIFQQFNAVSGRVATRPRGRSKGFGFVEFESTAARDAAFDKLQEVVVGGRTLTIKKAVAVAKPAPAAAETQQA